MKRVPRSRARQSGYAVLLATVLLVTVMLTVYLGRFDGPALRRTKDDRTAQALAQAKEALIGAAVAQANLPGALPCPDATNAGTPSTSGSNCQSYLGRLPWQTLGLADLRDGEGDCLWYAIGFKSLFRSSLPASSRNAATALNTATPGGITLQDAATNNVSNRVVAVIFSGGPPLGGQTRTAVGTPVCGGSLNAVDYLDTSPAPGTVNNASGPTTGIYVRAPTSATFNDTLVTITEQEIAQAVARRVLTDLRGYANKGLIGYYTSNGNTLPCAAPINNGTPGTASSGFFPYAALSYDSTTVTWLTNNAWYPQISQYAVSPSCASSGPLIVTITFAGQTPLTLKFP
jgi:hypothetical protein